MHELKIFENEEFGQVRTIQNEKGKVLFCGTDVAKALGYRNAFSLTLSDVFSFCMCNIR